MTFFNKTFSACCALFLSVQMLGATECEQQLKFSFDDRTWEKGFEQNEKDSSIIEYTLKGETVNDWTELVSVQKLIPISSKDLYYNIFIQKLKESVSPEKVESKIISKNDDSMVFEWWIDKGPEAQHEWFKLIQTPDSTLVLRYTTKKLDQIDKIRDTWEKILKDATYTQSGDCKKSIVAPRKASTSSEAEKRDAT